MHALQHTERFGNETYTVICGNHSVTVVRLSQSKSNANIKWRKYIYIDTNACVVTFCIFVVSVGRPSVPVLKAIAKAGSTNIAQLVCTSEGNPKPTIRWYGIR